MEGVMYKGDFGGAHRLWTVAIPDRAVGVGHAVKVAVAEHAQFVAMPVALPTVTSNGAVRIRPLVCT
ncbi:MAG: hypothetical protein RIS76_2822 [Verrucomicrobiota bacterium]|jgi:hypothetical protein